MSKDSTKDNSNDKNMKEYEKFLKETHDFTKNLIKLSPSAKKKLKYIILGATLNSNADDEEE